MEIFTGFDKATGEILTRPATPEEYTKLVNLINDDNAS